MRNVVKYIVTDRVHTYLHTETKRMRQHYLKDAALFTSMVRREDQLHP